MALANYRIMGLTVEGFRGFTTRQSISFDGRNIFIFGENGLGKSSIIEAIQWCLFGGADVQVRNSVYEKQECLVTLHLVGTKGNLTIKRELRPGHTESHLRIEDGRGKEVALREVFPQLAKLRSSERTQVIFAAQHATGRRSRADITEFGKVLYFYLNLEDVPDLIDRMSDLIEEQKSESDKFAKRIEFVADGYRGQRKRLIQLLEHIHANPPWENGPSPTAIETENRICDFVQEIATLINQSLPANLSCDDLLQKADEWMSLRARDMAAFQSNLRQRSQQMQQLEALILQAHDAEALVSVAEQGHRNVQGRVQAMFANISRKAIVNEIEKREASQTKGAAVLAVAESVAKLCAKYGLDACPACGSNLDQESLMEHVNDATGSEGRFRRPRCKAGGASGSTAHARRCHCGTDRRCPGITKAQSALDAILGRLATLAGRSPGARSLADVETQLAKLRSDLAVSRSRTDESGEAHKSLTRRINEYRQELRYHAYRRQVRDHQDFLHHLEELKVETAFKNALDRAIPHLNDLLSAIYQRLTGQRSFELVRVYHDPAKIGHLELRVASKRRPDKTHPPNVLNGQANKALHLLPYFVFSRFQPDVLELDLS